MLYKIWLWILIFFNIALYIGKFISMLLYSYFISPKIYYLKYIILLRLIKIDEIIEISDSKILDKLL